MPKASKISTSPTYDTQMIIVIILLLFAYPIGLIFMWAWMATWPTWIKIILSLPIFVVLFFIFLAFYFVGHTLRYAWYYNHLPSRRWEQMHNNSNSNMYITPTPTPYTY